MATMSTIEGSNQITNKNMLFYFDAANKRAYDGFGKDGYSLVQGTTASLLTGVTWSSSSSGTMRFNGTYAVTLTTYVADSWISCGGRIPELGVSDSLTFPFTLEAWINPKKLNGSTSDVSYGIFALDSMEQWAGAGSSLSNYYGIDLTLDVNNGTDTHDFQCNYYNPSASPGYGSGNRMTGITSNRPVVCGRWNHVAAVVSAPGTFDLYINGEAVANTVNGDYLGSTITWSGGTGKTVIGKGAGHYKYIFNGDIAMVRAYNLALSSAEIKDNYNLHAPRFGLTRK